MRPLHENTTTGQVPVLCNTRNISNICKTYYIKDEEMSMRESESDFDQALHYVAIESNNEELNKSAKVMS